MIAGLLTAAILAPSAVASVIQKGGVRVAVQGKFAPKRLSRKSPAPVSISVSGRISAADGASPPQLRKLSVAINQHGHLFSRGLPQCRLASIDPSTTEEALAVCGRSLVGKGTFSADVKLPTQSPFPSGGQLLAFYGHLGGKPTILAHIYGTKPVPTSYVLPFSIKPAKGTFGTVLEASLPVVTGEWGFVTGISMTLDRHFAYRGKSRSFLSASCPAPAGFNSPVLFPLLKATFGFEDGLNLTDTVTRTCKAGG